LVFVYDFFFLASLLDLCFSSFSFLFHTHCTVSVSTHYTRWFSSIFSFLSDTKNNTKSHPSIVVLGRVFFFVCIIILRIFMCVRVFSLIFFFSLWFMSLFFLALCSPSFHF
jgi:hypothetical protein